MVVTHNILQWQYVPGKEKEGREYEGEENNKISSPVFAMIFRAKYTSPLVSRSWPSGGY